MGVTPIEVAGSIVPTLPISTLAPDGSDFIDNRLVACAACGNSNVRVRSRITCVKNFIAFPFSLVCEDSLPKDAAIEDSTVKDSVGADPGSQ
jgi:hypothetical protein